jgi:hypothetical protein
MQDSSFSNLCCYFFVLYLTFLELTYTWFLFSLTESHAQILLRRVILGTDLSQFLQYSLLRIKDRGTLPDQVSGIRVREPDSSRRVAQVLTFQDYLRVVKVRTVESHCTHVHDKRRSLLIPLSSDL